MAFSVTVSGTILDQSGNPVVGMTVELKSETGQVVDSDVTSAAGAYSVSKSGGSGEFHADPKAKTPHYSDPGVGPAHAWSGTSNQSFTDDFTSQFTNQNPTRQTIGNQSFQEDSGIKTVTKTMSDPDAGDVLSVIKVSGPAFITFTKVSPSQYRLNADTNHSSATPGGHACSYKIQDQFGGASSVENLTVTITSANQPPTLTSPGNKTYQHNDGVKQFQLAATDPESDPITYSIVSTPIAGISVTAGGLVSIDTGVLARAVHNVTFRATATGGFDSKAITVTIQNNAPVLTNPGQQDFDQDQGDVTFPLAASDIDSDTLTYSKVAGESWADVDPATGVVTVNTNGVSPGTYPHTWEVDDGQGGTDQQAHDIVIGGINHPPDLANPGTKEFDPDTGVRQFQMVATDQDGGDILSFSKVSGAGFITTDAAGLVDVDTDGVTPGVYPAVMRVTDDGTGALTDDEAFSVVIGGGGVDDFPRGVWFGTI